jgi:hypothetical protein
MTISRILGASMLAAMLGASPGVAMSQMLRKEPRAAIKAQSGLILPDLRARLPEDGRRLEQAKLANFTRSIPQTEYVEAEREVARGDYRAAAASLDQVEQQLVEQQLSDVPN